MDSDSEAEAASCLPSLFSHSKTKLRFAHPPADVTCAAAISGEAPNTGFVTLCMDHEKGRCARDPCRWRHIGRRTDGTASCRGSTLHVIGGEEGPT